MTTDVIALTERMPDTWTLMTGLLSGGPDTTMDFDAEGALIRIGDEEGRPLATIEAPMLVQVPGEVHRLLHVRVDGPVWWTEVRAATAAEGAEALAGTAATRFANRLGGRVWPASATASDGGAAPVTGVTATAGPAAEQPAVDVLTEHTAVVIQDRPLVAMSAWLSQALRAAVESERGLQIVTPPTAHLTLPTRTVLSGLPNRWVVQDGEGGYYDGLSGSELVWQNGAFVATGTPAPAFTAQPPCGESQLMLSFRTRRPADGDLLLGGALETAWQALTGEPPAGWGTAEPAGVPWSRQVMTDFVRERAPESTWAAVVGRGAVAGGARPALATLRTDITKDGVEEDVTLTLGYAEGEELPLSALPDLAARLNAEWGLVSMLVQRRAARADLRVPPRLEGAPTPLAFVLGGRDLAEVGDARARTAPLPTPPVQLGPAGRAGFYYWLPVHDPGVAWEALQHLFDHLGGSSPEGGGHTVDADPGG